MTITTVTFNGGTPGNNVVEGVNDIDDITGGTPVYVAGYEETAVRNGGAANTTDTGIRVLLGMSGNHAGSIYAKYNTDHGSGSASCNFFVIISAENAFIAEFRCGPNNEFCVRINAGNLFTGASNSVPTNAWFRVDYILTGTSLEFRVYYDPDADSTDTPDITSTVTVGSATAAAVFMKAQSSTAIIKDFSFDTFRANSDLDWFDHFEPPSTGPTVTVWNGTTEEAATVTVWNGATEEDISEIEVT